MSSPNLVKFRPHNSEINPDEWVPVKYGQSQIGRGSWKRETGKRGTKL